MSVTETPQRDWHGRRAWLATAMLFLFMLVNFADKSVLGLSAVPIMRELELDHTQFGLIGSSFFLLFSTAAVCAGFLVNRKATKWVLAAMALIWSLCQLPMILCVGLPALIANRIVLGLGEGPAYPVALRSPAAAHQSHRHRRGRRHRHRRFRSDECYPLLARC